MINCDTCGKLIASGTGESMCRACRTEARAAAHALAVEYAAPVELEEVPMEAVDEAPPCVRCRKNVTMADSHFCLGCQLELVSSLGDAAEEIFRTPPIIEPDVSSTVSLIHDLEEKRQRTATSHMRLVGGTKLR